MADDTQQRGAAKSESSSPPSDSAQNSVAQPPHIVITMARQLGAGGAELGRRLAQRLGFEYIDRDILRVAAEKVGVTHENLAKWDERVSRMWERVLDSFVAGPPEGMFVDIPLAPPVRDQALFEVESQVVQELSAARNAVIIGRGAWWVLRDRPGLIRVYLHSPPEARVAAIMRYFNMTDPVAARKTIDQVDADRQRFIQMVTGRAGYDARNYDLAFNTQVVSLDIAEDAIVKAVKQRRAALTAKVSTKGT
jgi:CMP/dCMP kinase